MVYGELLVTSLTFPFHNRLTAPSVRLGALLLARSLNILGIEFSTRGIPAAENSNESTEIC